MSHTVKAITEEGKIVHSSTYNTITGAKLKYHDLLRFRAANKTWRDKKVCVKIEASDGTVGTVNYQRS